MVHGFNHSELFVSLVYFVELSDVLLFYDDVCGAVDEDCRDF